MKTCLECCHIFDRYSELTAGAPCPILFCSGEVVEIDDNILHTIHLLNEKGYSTAYCCSGHTWGNDPFIVFDNSITPKTFSSLPINFTPEVIHDGSLRIFCRILSEDAVERQKALMQAAVDLIEWADKLHPAEMLEVNFITNAEVDVEEFTEKVEKALFLNFIYSTEEDGKSQSLHFMNSIAQTTFDEHKKNIELFAVQNNVEVSISLID